MEENKVISQKINALQNQIKYLKNKRSVKCKMCGKEFIPYSLKEKYCSDDCRKKAIKEYKHKSYLKAKQNPEYLKKMRDYKQAWLAKTGMLKPKQETVSIEEYERLQNLYNSLVDRFNKVIEDNKRLIDENYALKNKPFLSKLKDLF